MLRSRAGRPAVLTEAQRRVLLLDAAACVFLAGGYAAATTHAIAQQAGMSKKTLYQIFPSKLALFDALLQDRLFDVATPQAPDDADQEECLVQLLIALATMLLLPDRIGLIRLIISDGTASPELSTAIGRVQMTNDLNVIETWLAREKARGTLPVGDVETDARLLFGMAVGEPMLQALVYKPEPAEGPSLEQRIRRAVRIFLRGLAAG